MFNIKKISLAFIVSAFIFLASGLVRSDENIDQLTCQTGLTNCLINCDEVSEEVLDEQVKGHCQSPCYETHANCSFGVNSESGVTASSKCPVIEPCPEGEKFSNKTCQCEVKKRGNCAVIEVCPEGYKFSHKTCVCELK